MIRIIDSELKLAVRVPNVPVNKYDILETICDDSDKNPKPSTSAVESGDVKSSHTRNTNNYVLRLPGDCSHVIIGISMVKDLRLKFGSY